MPTRTRMHAPAIQVSQTMGEYAKAAEAWQRSAEETRAFVGVFTPQGHTSAARSGGDDTVAAAPAGDAVARQLHSVSSQLQVGWLCCLPH